MRLGSLPCGKVICRCYLPHLVDLHECDAHHTSGGVNVPEVGGALLDIHRVLTDSKAPNGSCAQQRDTCIRCRPRDGATERAVLLDDKEGAASRTLIKR